MTLALVLALLVPPQEVPAAHPLGKDKTGLAWVLPFPAAREKARTAKRLLLIKPVAFGTTPAGGW